VSEWGPDPARLRAFEDAEWALVQRHYRGRLAAYVARRVPDRDTREDVLQETMLGAVRGIADYDPVYTFEQYLFGICHNRTIDALRRRRLPTIQLGEGQGEEPAIDPATPLSDSPSRIVRGRELAGRGRELLVGVLRDWVQETWAAGELVRLMVVEALFSGGWRNKDTWQRFDLRDETAVAGIKFRALKRMRALASERDPDGAVLPGLVRAVDDGEAVLEFTVAETWRRHRVSCPARYWLGRHLVGSLAEAPLAFVEFHTREMGCSWCTANLEDLRSIEAEDPALRALYERLERTTRAYLRSRGPASSARDRPLGGSGAPS